jgi:hypothetical protein
MSTHPMMIMRMVPAGMTTSETLGNLAGSLRERPGPALTARHIRVKTTRVLICAYDQAGGGRHDEIASADQRRQRRWQAP